MKTRPCPHCPFRSDRPFSLGESRSREISDSLLHDGSFPCHRSSLHATNPNDGIPCKGAAKLLDNVTGTYTTNVWFRVLRKQIGTIDDTVPVYRSIDEFIDGTK